MNPEDDTLQFEPKSLQQVAPILDEREDEREDEYDEEIITLAEKMGLPVKEMLELFEEWNNDDSFMRNDDPHHDCPPEWPDFTGCGGGYEDEGAAESGHGISFGFDYNTPLHMPPRIVIAESAIGEDA